MSKGKLGYYERVSVAEEYIRGKESYAAVAAKHGISYQSVQKIVSNYRSQGAESLRNDKPNKHYNKELKIQAVTAYLEGNGSQQEICNQYKIKSKTQLQRWITWYNGHKDFKESYDSGTEIYMTKGRNTTQQERTEIVAFCIEHGKDYPLTIQTYGISYQQIYSWVRKYEEKGINGLADGRGRTKPENEMTEIEKLQAENRILKAKNYDLEIENAFIKKLKELEGGGR